MLVARSVRFNAEADSLNCSILGPDAAPGTPEFDLYVKQLVTEMTVKSGQKCTAIRRALVPDPLLDAVAEAASARLAKVVIGNPADETVRMGALASLDQREEVRRSLKALLSAGTAVFGDPDHVEVTGADAERGAFMSPVLIRAEHAERAEPHEVEAFGPVSTLIGYRDTAHAIELAARGLGSLVGSVVTGDADFARDVVLGVAPWHGRLLVLDSDDAAESTGHGSPLPTLVHGGPGRAGGGEELGGIRGVTHHMQRTAVQASPKVLAKITGRWLPGSERTLGTHPFRKPLSQLRVGDAVTAGPRTVTAADIAHFAEFTGDTFYAHTDAEAAARNPFFDGIVAHGYLVVSLAAGLFVDPEPGPGARQLRHRQPALPHPGVPGRRADRDADLQGDHAARRQRARRGPLGRRGDQAGRLGGGQVRRPHDGGEGVAVMTVTTQVPPPGEAAGAGRALRARRSRGTGGSSRGTGCRTVTARR